MQNKIRHTLSRLLTHVVAVAAVAAAALTWSCADEIYGPTGKPNADGTYGPFELDIPIGADMSEEHSRATFNTSDIHLRSAWVAMFDATTGKVISMNNTTFDLGDDDGSYIVPSDHTSAGANFQVKLGNIYFNDSNPDVYIAGVGNYENITCRDPQGNEMSLIDALNNVTTIVEYKNISVNTASAEEVMATSNTPVMAGFWGAGHGNFTVNLKGEVYSNNTNTAKVELFDPWVKTLTTEKRNNITNGGMIHLRRLYSHINVTVNVDKSQFSKFENPSVQVFNVPRYTFIQEHKTVENAEAYDNASWGPATHTAADLFDDGYWTSPVMDASTAPFTSTAAGFEVQSGDVLRTSTSGNNMTINFGYWHYENKHWGLSGAVKNQNDRERMHGSSGVYSSLCPSPERDFNNNAAYMVLSADVVSKDGQYSGRANFIIHEGHACQPNGDATTDATVAALDFSTFRNCNYNYTVSIAGMDAVITKVTTSDLSGDFNHGVGGELWGTQVKDIYVEKSGKTFDMSFPEGQLVWAISEDGKTFGHNIDPNWDLYSKFSSFPTGVTEGADESSKIYNLVYIEDSNGNRYKLGEMPEITDSTAKYKLVFPRNTVTAATIYLCGIYISTDGTTRYYSVQKFDQDGTKLDAPILTMPNAPAGNLVLGLDDHTIKFTTVEGADKYRITLRQVNIGGTMYGGYSVTLAPGETHTDSDGVNTTLVQNPDGTMSYRMRYSNKQSALMNLVNNSHTAPATIEVIAVNTTNGAVSDPATVTKTVVNPIWDFSTTDWRNAVTSAIAGGAATGKFNQYAKVTVDGLTADAGTSEKFEYNAYGSYYGFRPNGKGTVKTDSNGTTITSAFHFHAFTKGSMRIWASSTSASSSNLNTNRYLIVALDKTDNNGSFTTGDATTKGPGNQVDLGKMEGIDAWNLSNTEDNIFVYSSADLLIYKIQFTPEDR